VELLDHCTTLLPLINHTIPKWRVTTDGMATAEHLS
jgi:hypothetical protein